MIEFGETGDVGRRIGMFTTIFAVGALVGPPISGAIYVATGGFEAVGYFAGARVFTSSSTHTYHRRTFRNNGPRGCRSHVHCTASGFTTPLGKDLAVLHHVHVTIGKSDSGSLLLLDWIFCINLRRVFLTPTGLKREGHSCIISPAAITIIYADRLLGKKCI